MMSRIARFGATLTLAIATVAVTPRCIFYLYEPKEPVDIANRLRKIKNK